jgi:hypothetical protein
MYIFANFMSTIFAQQGSKYIRSMCRQFLTAVLLPGGAIVNMTAAGHHYTVKFRNRYRTLPIPKNRLAHG